MHCVAETKKEGEVIPFKEYRVMTSTEELEVLATCCDDGSVVSLRTMLMYGSVDFYSFFIVANLKL